jgi:DNA repair exonuclease SbcCD nuclease subunit
LKRIADRGVPVVVVPGNHERSAIPYPLFAMHPRIHIFDRPRTFGLRVNDVSVAISGFPCERNGIRERFDALLGACGEQEADVHLLALHQSVEGAQVGPVNFTFRNGPDVIPRRAIPRRFAAVLAGHIHRHQVLDAGAPVFYPGATERTSSAEAGETKGCVKLALDRTGLRGWEFLPA